MKRVCKIAVTSATEMFPAGYTRRSNQELTEMGYDMDPEYIQEDKEVCKDYGLKFVGYAASDNDDDPVLVVAQEGDVQKCFEISNGRLYDVYVGI